MSYITVNRAQRQYQLSFEDLMDGISPRMMEITKDTKDTTTYYTNYISYQVRSRVKCYEILSALKAFNEKHKTLIETEDKSKLYRSFKIPKRSGGLRQIDAPNDELMEALYELKDILEKKLLFTYHTSAFAYVHGRSTIDAVRRHKDNGSRWILKTDLSKFFPNTTKEFLLKMLYQTFPICTFVSSSQQAKEEFEKAISLCFLNGGLPQGTPTSPMLTNQMMIPIDYKISKFCHEYKPHLVYTRYADDMDFSSKYSFHWTEVVAEVSKILESEGAPFAFNKDKTHYGSTAGRNWMLGVMLNKDGNITIGHEKKKNFKTCLFAFGNAAKGGTPWNIEDTQHLQGLYSYYKMVEGKSIDLIVNKYSEKFGFDLLNVMKEIIKGNPVFPSK